MLSPHKFWLCVCICRWDFLPINFAMAHKYIKYVSIFCIQFHISYAHSISQQLPFLRTHYNLKQRYLDNYFETRRCVLERHFKKWFKANISFEPLDPWNRLRMLNYEILEWIEYVCCFLTVAKQRRKRRQTDWNFLVLK